jgi:hypothetical protein
MKWDSVVSAVTATARHPVTLLAQKPLQILQN